MNSLEQFYKAAGSDAVEVVSRLGGSPALVMRFLMKFPTDGSFHQLCTALENGEAEIAFRAAHTLKGTCANLGLQRLYTQASAMTELLRGGAMDEAKAALPTLEQEYLQVLEGLETLNH